MALNRPPITGDTMLDSWMHEITDKVTRQESNNNVTSTSTADTGTPGSPGADGAPGVSSATIVLYKRSDTIPLPANQDIATEVVYNYTTGALNIIAPDGWTREYPPVEQGRGVFAIQVNISDTSATEIIPANAWSSPVLIIKDTDVLQTRVATDNGTALRSETLNSTTLKAVVSRNGDDQSDIAHFGYDYKWTIPTGQVVCVDANRNVINDGEAPMLATGADGNLVCFIGTPASSSEPADIHGSALREIVVGSEDVNKSQAFEVEVSNIPE